MRQLCLILLLFVATAATADGVTLPEFERIVLENGTVLILAEKKDVPLIGIEAVLIGGSIEDGAERSGLANLLAALLQKGAGERDAAEFAEAVDSVGGELSAEASLESITISGEFLSRDADLMIELVADMLQRPTFDENEFEKLRERYINFIRAAKDSNLSAVLPLFGNAFLYQDHPYGNPVVGSEQTLAELSTDDISQFYADQIGADRLIIAVSGDFDAGSLAIKLRAQFGEWRAAGAAPSELPAPPAVSGTPVLLVDKPGATQTYFWLANVGAGWHDPGRAATDAANTAFGGRFTSILNSKLRVESGLTYGARSAVRRYEQAGPVSISSFTKTESTIEAIDMALDLLDALHANGIDEQTLGSVKNYVLGSFPTRLETASQLAAQLARLERYQLGREAVDGYGPALVATTPDDVAAAIERVFPRRNALVLVLLGDAEQIRDAAAKYGPVTEVSITEPSFRVEAEPAND